VQNSDAESCGDALVNLLGEKKHLDAYQIGFDLSEVATQGFVEDVRRKLAEKELGPGEGLVRHACLKYGRRADLDRSRASLG
jgi:hypothetical protein